MLSTLKKRMTYANVASTLALVVAVGGGGAAVAASMVPANSVGSKQIINHAVKGVDLKNGAINNPSVFGTGNLGVVRGYAWNSSPSSSANLTDNGYTYNRSGGQVNVVHNGPGNYTITFDGMEVNGGNVVVSGYGSGAVWCKVSGWGSSEMGVLCFDSAGAATDSYWTIAVTD